MLTKSEAIEKLNQLGADRLPFSFYCDFPGQQWVIEPNSLNQPEKSFELTVNMPPAATSGKNFNFSKKPISFKAFKAAFDQVVGEINFGNSFLTNLTFQTPIETDLTLQEIFNYSTARYKLFVPDSFVVFSPETFVKIKDNKIFSHPMKGTIDANTPNAEERILSDAKEMAEHVTIVDLIRNDLSQVAQKVEVTRFRYVQEIQTHEKNLLQVSSEIQGRLDQNWQNQLGNILTSLLPAGSISGAPKPETIRIIRAAENYDRGFYTGICGHFDGRTLDTGVMIRFIKKEEDQLYYCSGGGITSFSDAKKEYQEMVDKVYLPFQ